MRNRHVVGFVPLQHTAGERFHKFELKLAPEARKRGGEVVVGAAQGYFARKVEQGNLADAVNAAKK